LGLPHDTVEATSTIFSWKVEEYDALWATCETDPLTPWARKHFPPHGRILEAGCGAGRYVKYLHDHGYDCVGIEFSGETVANVRRKWPELNVVQGDVAQMPFADDAFEGVLSVGVVEHFPAGPERPLAEMHRVLAPGGTALITVPCLNRLRRLKGPLCGIRHMFRANPTLRKLLGKPPLRHSGWNLHNARYRWHVFPEWGDFLEYRFAPEQFETFVQRAGFEILASVPLYHLGGLYHEFGRLVGRHVNWRLVTYPHARLLNRLLMRIPFFHNHMHLCVATKRRSASKDRQ